MEVWMEQGYEGKYRWNVGSEPEYTVEVGPTHHFPMYKKFIEDTEKYGGQAQLVPLPTGGFSWKGYVAGIVFPNPAEPNVGVKMAYNGWETFQPKILNFHAINWIADSDGNVSNLESDDTFYLAMHLS